MCHPWPTECFSLSMFNTWAPYHHLLLLKLGNSPFCWNHNFYCRKLPYYLQLQWQNQRPVTPNQSPVRRLNCTKFKGRREMEQIMGLDLMGPWAFFFKRLNKHHLHEVFMKWGLMVEESWWHDAFFLFMDAIMYRHIDGYVYTYMYTSKCRLSVFSTWVMYWWLYFQ